VPVAHAGRAGWLGERVLARIEEGAPDRVWSENDVVRIIREAAREFGQPAEDLLRVGRCESNLDPRAVNQAGPYFGLFQFLRSTWATTPYADKDIFDPVANASAAAWMWQQGRRNEWACQ
jgi:soluble lytic murein transglycosylase-like protein